MKSCKYVLDSNVFLTDPSCIESYGPNNLIIPVGIIEELDTHKKGRDVEAFNAREALRKIEKYTKEGKIEILKDVASNVEGLKKDTVDNQIVSCAFKYEGDVEVITNDTGVRLKCSAYGIKTSEYHTGKRSDEEEVYSGIKTITVEDKFIDAFHSGGLDVHPNQVIEADLNPNQFLVLQSDRNKKKRANTIYKDGFTSLKKLRTVEDSYKNWNITPKNIEQRFAFELLMDPNIKLVTIAGHAGCGKTLLSVCAGLSQVFSRGGPKHYRKTLVTRPVVTLGNDIGFLPGSLEEKMYPFLAPIYDNLDVLADGHETEIDKWFAKGKIAIQAMPYMRGRSINNSFIIVDEAQNLDEHELKTILTRAGEGSKIILTGDVEQIDRKDLSKVSNGLTHVIEKFKKYGIAGHITLQKGERSELAELAAKVL